MKIIQITNLYTPFPGGVSESVTRLSSALCKKGHEVIVYTGNSLGNMKVKKSEIVADGVTVKRILNFTSFQVLYGVFPNSISLFRDLKMEDPDIVHIHGIGHLENDYISMIAKRKPIVLTGHGGGMFYRPDRPWHNWAVWSFYCNLLGARTVKRANKIVAITPYEIKEWLEMGAKSGNISVIPWGIPSDCFGTYDGMDFKNGHQINGSMLFFAGSLVSGKGAQWLIKAMPEIIKDFPDTYAVICGQDLGFKADLVALARELGISDKVIFAGFLSREKLLQAYAACDVFVMPSDIEAFGLSIAQAMAFGKPVIASRVGGVPFVVDDGGSGLLFGQRDVKQLANCAKRLLADSSLRNKLGNKAKMLSKKYDWNVVCDMYEKTYFDLL